MSRAYRSRRLVVSSVVLATALSVAGCKDPDPNRFETHIELIKQEAKRADGFSGLERLTKTVVTAQNNDDLLAEFSLKVIPVFEEVWDDAEEQRQQMLQLMLDVGRPEGAALWSRAIGLDGSTDARARTILALEGIKKAKATEAAPAVIEELEKVISNPRLDRSDTEPGQLRVLMAKTLGELGDPKAVPVLIKALQQTEESQPVLVHRAAAEALGKIGDPSATDALMTAPLRVRDSNVLTNIGERVKIALAGVGEPAVPKLLDMLAGEHQETQELAANNGVEQIVVQNLAVGYLGVIGSADAVEPLIAVMPKDDCRKEEGPRKRGKKKRAKQVDVEEMDEMAVGFRAVTANALGQIGDPRAVGALCGCLGATRNPGDTYPMLEALGRIGGEEALSCLNEQIRSASYDTEVVEDGFEFEPRWEAARFAILAAEPDQIGAVEKAMKSNRDPAVEAKLDAWKPGIETLEKCKTDKDCFEKVLADVNAPWFAREKAAFEVARLAPGDVAAAEAVAKAFKVRNPDARVHMAWLPPRMLDGKPCPACIESYEAVLDAEKMSMDATYQLSLLMVWYSTPKLQ